MVDEYVRLHSKFQSDLATPFNTNGNTVSESLTELTNTGILDRQSVAPEVQTALLAHAVGWRNSPKLTNRLEPASPGQTRKSRRCDK